MAQIQDVLRLALRHYSAGRLHEAAGLCRDVLRAVPDHPLAAHLLGMALCGAGNPGKALPFLRQAVVLDPGQPAYIANLAVLLDAHGHRPETAMVYRWAVRLMPGDGKILSGLGSALGDLGLTGEALGCLERAAAVLPAMADLQRKIAILRQRQGHLDEARRAYRRAWLLGESDGMLLREALTLPVIARSLDDIAESRRRFMAIMAELEERGARIADPVRDVGVTSFFLSYHGLDDRPLNEALARVHASACPSLLHTAPHCLEPARPSGDGRLRVGFVSDYFFGHTIGRLNQGLIERLDRDRFHVTLFLTAGPEDALRRDLRAAADTVVALPADLDGARRRIAAEELDILYYTDIGMSPFTYFLAFARLAPVQCLTWGHPDTTGIPTLDYFLTCDAMEPDGAEAHYGETLVRLPGPTVHYRRPRLAGPRKGREDFGLPPDAHLYLCPQSLFKIHPDFDRALLAILRRDPRGLLVFVDPRGQGGALMERIGPQASDVADRVRFLPGLGNADFIALMADCDVMLDPFHYSGGNTTLEAFAFGTPVVTWPGAFMRGRHTYGFYRLIGMGASPMEAAHMDACVARDHDDYVERALRLGTDPALRSSVRSAILDRCNVLFESDASVRAIEDFLADAVRRHKERLAERDGQALQRRS